MPRRRFKPANKGERHRGKTYRVKITLGKKLYSTDGGRTWNPERRRLEGQAGRDVRSRISIGGHSYRIHQNKGVSARKPAAK